MAPMPMEPSDTDGYNMPMPPADELLDPDPLMKYLLK